ncbi:DUF6250 domain-containing protein [Carboxylicivirga sp. M1479]|uniref:DUF6250 domain-containing protein n=1 Tax=Carboxylicivirga sp. M1479 TaxID=2594476 RepID=UPI001177E437|nr:DUF6250 domain-containing protein [Carboxylicivirga sp. M1479]TRX71894.1 hypothetical protein FNN09_04540 [Carboxylicivirga sp. M1479]
MQTTTSFICMALLLLISSCANHQKKNIRLGNDDYHADLLYHDNFNSKLDNWTVEQREGGTVQLVNNSMDIDDVNGCTVWFNTKLKGNVLIEYDAIVIDKGGANDRVSDLNCFWMAKDLNSVNFFDNSELRGGKFQNYHDMQLYYVGLGGHDNSKTRFRKYAGGGDRPCLPEHDLSDQKYLITANQTNTIRLLVYNGQIQYYRNEQLIYNYRDDTPYTEGYFGIRTYKNHMSIDNFKVYQLSQ